MFKGKRKRTVLRSRSRRLFFGLENDCQLMRPFDTRLPVAQMNNLVSLMSDLVTYQQAKSEFLSILLPPLRWDGGSSALLRDKRGRPWFGRMHGDAKGEAGRILDLEGFVEMDDRTMLAADAGYRERSAEKRKSHSFEDERLRNSTEHLPDVTPSLARLDDRDIDRVSKWLSFHSILSSDHDGLSRSGEKTDPSRGLRDADPEG